MREVVSKTVVHRGDGLNYTGFSAIYYKNLIFNNAEMERWRKEATAQLRAYFMYLPIKRKPITNE